MPEYVIKRHSKHSEERDLMIKGVDIDNTLYNIKCKIRNRTKTDHREPFVSVPAADGFLAFTVDKDPTNLERVAISLTIAETTTLIATDGVAEDELPLLDFELELIADTTDVQYTTSQTVSVLESQAHDD